MESSKEKVYLLIIMGLDGCIRSTSLNLESISISLNGIKNANVSRNGRHPFVIR